jgi:hypothetical protein
MTLESRLGRAIIAVLVTVVIVALIFTMVRA